MIRTSVLFSLLACLFIFACSQPKTNTITSTTKATTSLANNASTMPTGVLPPVLEKGAYNELTDKEAYVILQKGTERSFSGAYHAKKETGTYICRQCNLPLFTSDSKFKSGTGWPSFDDEYTEGAVEELTDADGRRVEIVCGNCGGHLGHVFRGEGMTPKSTRHCVNSASINFVPTTN